MSAISIAQGSDHILDITALGDLTGAVVYLAVRNEAGTVVISKATNVGGQGIIVAPAATSGTARIYFVPSDTTGLTVGAVYFFDAWKVDNAGTHHQVAGVNSFNITPRVVVLP